MEQRLERASARQMGQTRALVMTGLFAALGCVATLVLQIPSPTGGYLNLGDTVVILGGVGPALADLLSGYTVYVPATLVIKAAMGLLAAMLYRAAGKKAWGMVVCATAAEAVMVAGYWLFDALLMLINGGGRLGVCLSASAVGIPSNLVQAAFGLAASTLLAMALRRSGYVRGRFPNL